MRIKALIENFVGSTVILFLIVLVTAVSLVKVTQADAGTNTDSEEIHLGGSNNPTCGCL